MKKLFSSLLVAIAVLVALPSTVWANPNVNVGGASMCKPIAEIVINEDNFNGSTSVSMSSSDFDESNGTVGYVTVRGIATNTGNLNASVPISIANTSGSSLQSVHSFTVTVDGVTRTVSVATPSPTTITQVNSYDTVRTSMLGDMADTPIGVAINKTYSIPGTGSNFANDYVCDGYGTFNYAPSTTPGNKSFEKGMLAVYKLVKKGTVVQNDTCNVNLSANPSVTSGNSSVLTWTSNTGASSCVPATSCAAENSSWSTNSNANGNATVFSPGTNGTTTTNYQVRCNFPDGTQKTANTSVTWQNTVVTNANCPVNLDATPSVINPGGTVGLNWSANAGSCTPANYCFADDSYGWGNGQLANSGYRSFVAPQSLTSGQLSFRIKCYYPDSSIKTDDAYVTIQQQYVPPPPPCTNCNLPPNNYTNPGNSGTSGIAGSPIVRTLAARSIEKKSAKLRGYFNANGCPSITTWFEYSTDRNNLEFRSDSITQANKYGNVEFVATNLKAGTKYYYRIVGENCKGLSLGATEWFRTASGTTGVTGSNTTNITNTQTTTIRNTTVVDTSIKATGAGTSYLRLDVTNDNDIPDDNDPTNTVIRGEVVVYRIVWENLTTSMLRDGKIKVNLPKALSFMNSSNGLYDKDSHSVYMTIGDIAGRASGVEFITVSVTTAGQIGDPVIVEAIAAFDAPGSDAQVNATDFDEDILGDRNVAVATTPYFGNWMWIIGLILLLILVFLIARYHTLASQYNSNRNGYMPNHNYQPVYTAPSAAPMRAPESERDPFVPPSSLPRDEGGPVYKPFNPNN